MAVRNDGFRTTSLSTYDFSTLYSTLSHNLIKEKLLDLNERAFKKIFKNRVRFILPVTFFTSTDAFSYLLDNIYIRFGNKLYRQIDGIPMGSNFAPFVAD